jgi:hypothetical protein
MGIVMEDSVDWWTQPGVMGSANVGEDGAKVLRGYDRNLGRGGMCRNSACQRTLVEDSANDTSAKCPRGMPACSFGCGWFSGRHVPDKVNES